MVGDVHQEAIRKLGTAASYKCVEQKNSCHTLFSHEGDHMLSCGFSDARYSVPAVGS